MRMRQILAPAAAAAAALWCLAAVPASAGVRRDGGPGFTISLAASSTLPYAGTSVTLTATANANVGPTPYYISIYSETTGAELALCGTGTACSAAVSQSAPGNQQFQAFVGDDVPGDGAPGFVLVSSNVVTVSWWNLGVLGPRGPGRPAMP
jgi:hypothetical protein